MQIRPTAGGSHAQVREVILVANDNASGVVARGGPDRVARALAALGAHVELVRTRTPDEMAAVWEPVPGRRVVLFGGDGTLHCAANLPGAPPDIALVPGGRANNVARCLGIPDDPEAAAAIALAGDPVATDVIGTWTGGRRVIAVEGLSVGFLALARARYHAANSADVRAAVRAASQALRHFHPLDVRLVSHGEIDVIHVGQLFVANMSSFGTGLRVAPDADPHDGRLDVVALDVSGRLAIPLMLARLRRGSHFGHRGVYRWRVRRLRIETRGRSPIMADTEDLGSGPVDVAVVSGALPIVMPPAGR